MEKTYTHLATRSFWGRHLHHVILCIAAAMVVLPLWLAFAASTHTNAELNAGTVPILPGDQALNTYGGLLGQGAQGLGVNGGIMVLNTLISALGISLGKVIMSLCTAYALAFFRFRGKNLVFALLLLTLMLPVEVRIIPTFQVVATLGLTNTYGGLILPLMVSATAVLLFRQTFLAFPRELAEAAQMDGQGPLGFFFRILIPMSRNEIGGMFVILFIYGWNQYLWPLIISSRENMYTLGIGLNRMLATGEQQADWPGVLALALITMIPPIVLMLAFQGNLMGGQKERDK